MQAIERALHLSVNGVPASRGGAQLVTMQQPGVADPSGGKREIEFFSMENMQVQLMLPQLPAMHAWLAYVVCVAHPLTRLFVADRLPPSPHTPLTRAYAPASIHCAEKHAVL